MKNTETGSENISHAQLPHTRPSAQRKCQKLPIYGTTREERRAVNHVTPVAN